MILCLPSLWHGRHCRHRIHGQTILHRAPAPKLNGRTRQLGDGALMAQRTGTACHFDFRSADMAQGGQGGAAVPVYHATLLTRRQLGLTAILNLGGISNITWCDSDFGQIIGFDTGPANAPIDDWIRRHGAGSMDSGGKIAATGSSTGRSCRSCSNILISKPPSPNRWTGWILPHQWRMACRSKTARPCSLRSPPVRHGGRCFRKGYLILVVWWRSSQSAC